VSGSYRATSEGSGGRGPTSDIRPLSTLNNCGSSSIEYRRRTRPTRVIRGSSRILNRTPRPWSLRSTSSVNRDSASVTMDRNFHIRKGTPSRPTRVCRKNTGPGLLSRTSAAVTSSSGLSTSSSAEAPRRSIVPLTSRRPPVNSGSAICRRGSPDTGRTWIRGPATSVRAGATSRSTPVPSRVQAIRRSMCGVSPAECATATVSASTASRTRRMCATDGSPAIPRRAGRHTPTTRRPECALACSFATRTSRAEPSPTTSTRCDARPAARTRCSAWRAR